MAELKVYWLSFRVKEDDTAKQRRDDLYEYIEKVSDDCWDSTTSFLIFDSEKGITAICSGLSQRLAKHKDQFVIRYMSTKTGYYWGKIKDVETLELLTGFSRYA